MDPTKLRLRYLVGILLAAALTAALLRHVIHTYGGVPREQIGVASFTVGVGILLIVLLFIRYRPRR